MDIVGQNGTGKSSILAAIIAALGGNPNKHSTTAGGAKAGGGLIRDGSDWAQVDLEIANAGPDPFHPFHDGAGAPATLVVTLRLKPHNFLSVFQLEASLLRHFFSSFQ